MKLGKLNILHITTFLQGGAGRVLTELAIAQKIAGHEVFVLADNKPVPGYESYKHFVERLANNTIPFIELSSFFKRNLSVNIKVAEQVRDFINNHEIDIIHAHSAIPAFVGLLARSSAKSALPVIMTMQGWGENKKPEQAATDIAIMNLVDAVIPVSDASAKLLRDLGVKNHNIHVICNAVESSQDSLTKHLDEFDELYTKINYWQLNQIPVVGCIGSIGKRKNQECLIRAVAKIPDLPLACLLIGEEENPGKLKALISELNLKDKIIITGFRSDAESLLQKLSILVLPSRSEGLPLAVIEAFRDGIPVIGTDIPAIAELIEDNLCGRLFPNNDSTRLSMVIRELVDSKKERKRLSDEAKRRYHNKYRFSLMKTAYDNLYRNHIMS